ncbi:MAG TPA: hypothetical protein VJ898_13425 [Natrialbaceae archaeon]|nr:hypothetical protein [Natrialbaceae archaeon]
MTDSESTAETIEDRNERSTEPPVVQPEHSDSRSTAAATDSFGWRGWVLLAVVAFSFVVVPVVVIWRPPLLPRWVALVALPMVPGILLGATAVWAALRG